MEDISKPRIVDFLRTCDKHNWVFPRIRFASVRSKPELIEDIDYNFKVTREGSFISIVPRRLARRIPAIQYDLDEKKYLLDGEYHEFRKESREKPHFLISRGPVTIVFESFHASKESLSKHTVSGSLLPFLIPGTGGVPTASS